MTSIIAYINRPILPVWVAILPYSVVGCRRNHCVWISPVVENCSWKGNVYRLYSASV